MSDMKRPRRIRTDILDLNLRRVLLRQLSERIAGSKNPPERIIKDIPLQIKIQEAGPRNLRMIQPCAIDALGQFFRYLARIPMKHARRLHGKVRSKITEFFLRRHFKNNRRQLAFRECTIRDGIPRRLLNRGGKCFFDIQCSPPDSINPDGLFFPSGLQCG